MDSDLIELIYDAALDGTLWPRVLAGVAMACGAVSATLVPAHDLSGLMISPGADESHEVYARHWFQHDIIAQAIFASRRHGIFCDWLLIDPATRARHAFYQEFRRAFDLRDNLTFASESGGEFRFGLSLQMPLSAPVPDDEAIGRFAALGRHISRAMVFARRAGKPDPQTPVLSALMSALTCGAACLDGDGRVLMANPALLALAGDGLRVVRGRLEAADLADQPRLNGLIGSHLRQGPASGPPIVSVRRPSGRRPLVVAALPLSPERRAGFFGGDVPGCRAVLTVVDPDARAPAQAETALAALGLSPAEARLAMAIGEGLAPRAAADRLLLTEGTVRTRLKQVYGKLGLSRQSELARLVTQLSMLNGP